MLANLDYRSFVILPGAVNARPGMFQQRSTNDTSMEIIKEKPRLSAAAPSFIPNRRCDSNTFSSSNSSTASRERSQSPSYGSHESRLKKSPSNAYGAPHSQFREAFPHSRYKAYYKAHFPPHRRNSNSLSRSPSQSPDRNSRIDRPLYSRRF